MGQVTWNGAAVLEAMTRRIDARLDRAAEQIAVRMRGNLETPYPPASSPGESPHRRTGNLQGQVQVVKPAPLVRQVGSNARYAAFLELGTSRMAARPWALKSLMEGSQDLVQAVAGPQQIDATPDQLEQLFGIEFVK